jgi:hypothetical protein
MTLWARLTWQAKEPAALAGELARRLSVAARPGGLVAGARLLELDGALLEVRPWLRESQDDRPRAAGRLVLEPVPNGEEPPAPTASAGPPALVGLGWCTVELERAEHELDPWIGPRPPGPAAGVAADADGLVHDEHLGARARLREGAGLPGAWMVLLEPSTEGRAAASLARDGEGPCALYLRPGAGLDAWLAAARAGGITVGARRDGPFGSQVLLAGSPAGPHVILTEGRTPVSADPVPGTIAP